MLKKRGFEIAKGWEDKDIHLPIRKTARSVGYDLEAAEDTVIPSFKLGTMPTLIPTGIKVYCEDDEWFILANRSSGPKKGLVMCNGIGIADADYYGNETNDGHIFVQYYNLLDHDIIIKKGDSVAQLIFQKFLIADEDHAEGIRKGGFGTTDAKK